MSPENEKRIVDGAEKAGNSLDHVASRLAEIEITLSEIRTAFLDKKWRSRAYLDTPERSNQEGKNVLVLQVLG